MNTTRQKYRLKSPPSRTKLGWDAGRLAIRNTQVIPTTDVLDLSTLEVVGYLCGNRVATCTALQLNHFDWIQLIGNSGTRYIHLLCTRDEVATIVVVKCKTT